MGLVRCPDCGREVSDSAPACIGCGRPNPGAAAPLPIQAESPRAGPRCGRCGGTVFKKLSLLYDENRSHTASTTRGAALGITSGGGVGIGVGGAASTGISMTGVASRVAPPDRKRMAKDDGSLGAFFIVGAALGGVAYAIAGLVWGVIVLAVVLLGGAVVAGLRSAPEVEERYRAAYAEWERRYMCMQCGAIARAEETRNGELALETLDGDPELDDLIRARQKIHAVRHVRDQTGVGLAEALHVVETRSRELGIF